MAGYSGTPLVAKLGIKSGHRVYVRGAPFDYLGLVGNLPGGARILKRPANELDVIHLFVTTRRALERAIAQLRPRMRQNGMLWVSWPKKASGVPSDITEGTVRECALPTGLVDIKVCAVDEVWSGLKLVIRRAERRAE